VIKDEQQAERMQSMGIKDWRKIYTTEELAPEGPVLMPSLGTFRSKFLVMRVFK